MTGSQCIRLALGLGLGAFLLTPGLPAGADHHGDPPIEMVSTNVQGKNIYIPGTVVVEAGKPRTLSIFNTTDTPHGFSIKGAGIEAVLPPKEEHEVELPAMKPGIYLIHCQLHPPHRNAQLLVIESE
jgi:heme/copper-type cytochrome/quinol oxidase subunit 2